MGKNIEDEVKKAVGNEPVPESLRPEQIEKMLEGRKPRRFSYRRLGAVAAAVTVVALAGGVGFRAWHNHQPADAGKGQFSDGYRSFDEAEVNVMDPGIPAGVTTAKNYKQVFDMLVKSHAIYDNRESYAYDGSIGCEAKSEVGGVMNKAEAAVPESAPSAEYSQNADASYSDAAVSDKDVNETANGEDFSEVNAQVEGVAEADIMVTDGAYLYLCHENENRICIVTPDKQTGALTLSSDIDLGETVSVREMYIQNGKLVILADEYEVSEIEQPREESSSFVDELLFGATEDCVYPNMTKTYALAITYDVSDREHPREAGRMKMDGMYADSRLVDGCLYMFSQYNDFYMVKENMVDDAESYIPCVQDSCIAKERIFIPDTEQAEGYLVGVSVDINEPSQAKDEFAVMMYGSQFYVSQGNIYIAQDYNDLQLVRFAYEHGEIRAEASGKVRGWINDSFSMDEYNGYLRLVTTSYKGNVTVSGEIDIEADGSETAELKRVSPIDESVTVNNLYVLDYSLNVVGQIEDLAPEEKIYSARFMGDVGYFVTYREVDPLFSVDLSHPDSPKVLGELKISGFSEYLHPYGDGRLLGIGWETSPNGYGGVRQDGLKLSMFDISNPSDVSELARMIQKDVIDTGVGGSHRTVMMSVNKNLFGFCVQTAKESRYCTYRYTEGVGFEKVTDTIMDNDWNYWGTRGVFIKDVLYISDGTHVYSVSLADGSTLDELNLTQYSEK